MKCSVFCREHFHWFSGSNGLLHFIPHAPVCRSVVEVCRYMNRYSGPKFLMGDFNSIPYSKEMAYLRGEVPLEGTYCRDLTDVWRESPQYRNMATKPSDRAGLTFSAIENNPTKRVGIYHCMYSWLCVCTCMCVCVIPYALLVSLTHSLTRSLTHSRVSVDSHRALGAICTDSQCQG